MTPNGAYSVKLMPFSAGAWGDLGLVFHLYEWAGKPGSIEITVPPGATAATETNLMEQPLGQPLTVSGDKITVPVRPYEIVAVRVDYSSPIGH